MQLNQAPNCSAVFTYDSTSFPAYDTSTSCNEVAGADLSIGDLEEPYTGSACTGISTMVFLPPAHSISPSLAPFPKPGYLQGYLEQQVAPMIEALPSYLMASCQESLRLALCGSFFLRPQNFSSSFYDTTLPSYPSKHICNSVRSSCGKSFESSYNYPYLNDSMFDCSTTINGIEHFPTSPQIVYTANTRSYDMVNFQSSPNMMQDAVVQSSVSCPMGFFEALPQDLEAGPERSRVVTGTGCVAGKLFLPLSSVFISFFFGGSSQRFPLGFNNA